jgi:hypothetical protein
VITLPVHCVQTNISNYSPSYLPVTEEHLPEHTACAFQQNFQGTDQSSFSWIWILRLVRENAWEEFIVEMATVLYDESMRCDAFNYPIRELHLRRSSTSTRERHYSTGGPGSIIAPRLGVFLNVKYWHVRKSLKGAKDFGVSDRCST